MQTLAQEKYGRVLSAPPAPGSWVCLDFGDVIAHVFTPADRQHYNVEGLYRMATPLELPFPVVQEGPL